MTVRRRIRGERKGGDSFLVFRSHLHASVRSRTGTMLRIACAATQGMCHTIASVSGAPSLRRHAGCHANRHPFALNAYSDRCSAAQTILADWTSVCALRLVKCPPLVARLARNGKKYVLHLFRVRFRSADRRRRSMNNFISMFSGAGGLDLGFEQAGWTRRFASDLDADAVATLRANSTQQERSYIGQNDIRDLTAEDVFARAGDMAKGNLVAIVGGPPCQSWSSAGHQMGLADERGQLFRYFIKLANSLDPRFIVMENVRGLLTARGPDGEPGSALALLREDLRKEGWQTTVSLLNAADFGVAQRRVRLFVIAHRTGDCPEFPKQTHAREPDNGQSEWVSLEHCLSSVQSVAEDEIICPTPRLAAELAQISPGSGVKSPGKAEATRPGGHWGYKQGAFIADLSVPARTVTASTAQDWIIDPIHGLRRLCPRECAAVQSFPAAWKWEGKRASVYRQIGNAVPPKLAKAVAMSLSDHIENAVIVPLGRTIVQELTPLDTRLLAAIAYTKRDEARNGKSRRSAPALRRRRVS